VTRFPTSANRGLVAVLGAVLCLGVLAGTSPAQAQDLVEPSAAQLQLNDQGYKAFVEEDWERAIRLYQALLDLGPLNTAYASLGYALFKAGRCEEARAAYDLATTAPQVVDPPPEAVAQALEAYREKLSDTCPGFLVLQCRPRRLQVSVDGSPLTPCDDKPIAVPRGDHVVIAAVDDQSIERTVYVDSMESVPLQMVIEGVEDLPDPDGPTPGDNGGGSAGTTSRETGLTGTLGWITAGTGGAVLLTAVGVDLFVLDSSLQELRAASSSGDTTSYDSVKPSVESQQALVQGLLISGGLLVATGVTLYLIDLLGAPERAPDKTSFLLAPTPGGAALEIRW
jgi:hypothetical protein